MFRHGLLCRLEIRGRADERQSPGRHSLQSGHLSASTRFVQFDRRVRKELNLGGGGVVLEFVGK